MQCNARQRNSIRYYKILYYTILYDTIRYDTMLCYAMLYYAMLCYAMLCYPMLCYTILYYTTPELSLIECVFIGLYEGNSRNTAKKRRIRVGGKSCENDMYKKMKAQDNQTIDYFTLHI